MTVVGRALLDVELFCLPHQSSNPTLTLKRDDKKIRCFDWAGLEKQTLFIYLIDIELHALII